jgi:hypothetical protein
MIGRLIIGIVKGLIVGGLLGFALVKLGFAVPGAIVAYFAAALAGVLIGLVAGKPIWAKDAKIEAGMKAGVGAVLGIGLMFAVRRWLQVDLPFSLGELGAQSAADNTLGGLAMTSLAMITAVLGGFYEADNTPSPTEPAGAIGDGKTSEGKRVAAQPRDAELDEELDGESSKKRANK